MDSSKIDKSLPYTFADIGEIDAIITNRDLPPELSRKAQENGTEIIIAKPGI